MSSKIKVKKSYSIGEISKMLNIPIDTLRYYEKSGLTPTIQRNSSGYREYTESDEKWLGFVNCLKSTGMPLNKIKQYLEYMKNSEETILERRELIVEHQKTVMEEMEKIQLALDRINLKVEFYDDLVKKHGLDNLDIN